MVEYALVLAVVVAGLLAMQIYLKRGIQGRLRLASESQSENRYSPGMVNSDLQTYIYLDTLETNGLGWSTSDTIETRTRTGNETVDGK